MPSMIHEGHKETDQRSQLLYDLELRFPPLSRTVSEISALLSNKSEAPSTERLIEIVEMDPVVVSSVLRRINSAYYGLQRHFDDISKAIVMIGFMEVSNIVLTSGYVGVRKSVTSKAHAALLEKLIRISVGTGFFMRLLSSRIQVSHMATAYTTGLLHSVGRLVLLYNNPDEYADLWEENRTGYAPSAEAELNRLGIDHTQLGGIAAAHWNLPSPIGELIESYLTPGHIEDPMLRTLALSLKVSVNVAEQVCAYRDALAAEGQTAFDEVRPDFAFSFIPELALLAQSCGKNTQDLEHLISSNQQDAFQYIESMTQ
ncbi:MAG: HDOD domain-containing protein [Rhodothermales bacterium]